jgi:hypothetical protein
MATNATKKMKTDLKCQVCGDNSFGVNYGAGKIFFFIIWSILKSILFEFF